MQPYTLLVIDDNRLDLEIISTVCSALNFEIEAVSNPLEALARYEKSKHTVVLTDYMMDPIDGTELIRRIHKIDPDASCLLMTGYLDARIHEFASEMELNDIITKPIRPMVLAEQLRLASNKQKGATPDLDKITISNRMDQCVALLGQSEKISRVREKVASLVKKNSPFLLEGPSGVGKPEIIQFIHHSGQYARSPLIFCHCKKLSPQELEQKLISRDGTIGSCVHEAKHGMLVLSHVDSVPLQLQPVLAKNISAFCEKCRVAILINALIDDLLEEGKICDELYFALSLDTVHVPALADRPEDIEEIVRFVAASAKQFELKHELPETEVNQLLADLKGSNWQGNLRELIEKVRLAAAA